MKDAHGVEEGEVILKRNGFSMDSYTEESEPNPLVEEISPKNTAKMKASAEILAKSIGNIEISPTIDFLKAYFSSATIRSIKQMLEGKAEFTLSSDEDITKWLEKHHGKKETWKG